MYIAYENNFIYYEIANLYTKKTQKNDVLTSKKSLVGLAPEFGFVRAITFIMTLRLDHQRRH